MYSLEQLRLGIVTRGRACPPSRACQEGPAAQHRALCMCPEHKSPLQHPAPQCRRSGDKPQPARGISSGVRNRFRGIELALPSGWMATNVQPHMPSHTTQLQTATSCKPPGFHDMAPSSEGIAIRFVPPGRPTHVRIADRVCATLYCEGPTQARTHLKFCCTSPLHGGHSLFLPPCN